MRSSQNISRAVLETLERRRLLSFTTETLYPVGAAPTDMVAADVNGDGRLDLVTANRDSNTISVLRGNANGTFQAALNSNTGTGGWDGPFNMAVGDVTGDGEVDVVVAAVSGHARVMVGDGTGAFQPAASNITLPPQTPAGYAGGPLPQAPTSIAIGDLNADGKLDLVVSAATTYQVPVPGPYGPYYEDVHNYFVNVLIGAGNGSFALASVTPNDGASTTELADFNTDGKLDIFAVNDLAQQPSDLSVMLGNGNGTFQPIVRTPGGYGRPVLGDFDNDGKLDVFRRNEWRFYKGLGNGTFERQPHGVLGGWNSVPGDVNGDGKLDLVDPIADQQWDYTNPPWPTNPRTTDRLAVRLGYGDGSFAPEFVQDLGAQHTGAGNFPDAVVADLNGDGRRDLASIDQGLNRVIVALNQGGWAAPPAALNINDVTIAEGNAGTTNAVFTVRLLAGKNQTVTVNYATANGDAGTGPGGDAGATAGTDYIAVSGTLTFAPGETTKTIAVPITGDTRDDGDVENFLLNFSAATNANLIRTSATASIVDNDPKPTLSINDVTKTEGNSGNNVFGFTLTLSGPSDRPVVVDAWFPPGGLASGSDFTIPDYPWRVTFAPGQTTATFNVPVITEKLAEPVETFYVSVDSHQAVVTDPIGIGTILDDDGTTKTWVGPVSGGSWSTPANWSPSGVPGASDDVIISNGATVTLGSSATVDGVSLLNGGSLVLATSGSRVLRTRGLAIGTTSKLNLNDNDLIYDHDGSGPSPAGIAVLGSWPAGLYTGVTGMIARGYTYGDWTGDGLVTTAPPARAGVTTLAVAETAGLFDLSGSETAMFSGQTVDSTAVLVKYTYVGDVNLDGLVDGADYGVLDNWVQFPGTSGYWNGDFNFDGVIDGADYGLIDNAIQLQGAPL